MRLHDIRLFKSIRLGSLGRRRPVAATQEVLAEIRGLSRRLPHVTGVLVATVDGLLMAHELDAVGVEPDTIAAMAAAQLGLGRQIARGTAQGEFLETVTRAAGGYLAVFAAGTDALLTVVAGTELNIGRLHHEARPVAERVGELVTSAPP
jgi:predicted regulator of Ras-like GTPase activity (Roadblock/LC7/MglB family)